MNNNDYSSYVGKILWIKGKGGYQELIPGFYLIIGYHSESHYLELSFSCWNICGSGINKKLYPDPYVPMEILG